MAAELWASGLGLTLIGSWWLLRAGLGRRAARSAQPGASLVPPARPAAPSDAEWLRALNALRSLASRKNAVRGQCAAIVVKDGEIKSWGYARSLVRAKRAGSRGSDRADLHAEADAVTAAALNGVCLEGGTLYCTIVCCRACFALVAGAGITRVVTPGVTGVGALAHAECNAAIGAVLGIEICDDAVVPPYEPVSDDGFLPKLRRRIPGDEAEA